MSSVTLRYLLIWYTVTQPGTGKRDSGVELGDALRRLYHSFVSGLLISVPQSRRVFSHMLDAPTYL